MFYYVYTSTTHSVINIHMCWLCYWCSMTKDGHLSYIYPYPTCKTLPILELGYMFFENIVQERRIYCVAL